MRRPFVTADLCPGARPAARRRCSPRRRPRSSRRRSRRPRHRLRAAGQPAAPKLAFTTPAGILLVQIKPDQTAVFEEMMAKLKAGLAKTQRRDAEEAGAGCKIYKSSEPFGANALYVVVYRPRRAERIRPVDMCQRR